MSADADRIAALEAELARRGAWSAEVHRLTAELAEAIEQRDIARAEWQGADCKADAMRAERDAALADVKILDGIVQRYEETNATLIALNKASTAELEALAARVPLLESVATLTAKMDWKSMCICHLSRPEKCLACTILDTLAKLAALDEKGGTDGEKL